MQRCTIWTVSLAAALSLTGAAWAEHEGGGGHGPAASHGTTPTFAKHRGSDDEARESHSGAQNSEGHSAANFAARLANNTTLSARLQNLLTALISNNLASSTMDPTLQAAAKGFRNLGQFIAALHAATDQKISFDQLKADMTGPGHDSLGQAIQDLKPTDATTLKSEVTQARQEAKADEQAARAAQEKAEDAKESAKDKSEDAKEAAKEKAEDANEGHSAANFAARLATRMANDPTLAAEVNSLVMSTGMSVQAAAMGFRNLNQFLTALHAAKDLGLDFGQLQKDMTGPGHDSLAQAILDQQKTSTLDATTLKADVTKARQEAKADLQAVRAAEDKAEDAKEAAQEAAEDAKEAAKEAAEEANEAAKAPAGTTTSGSSAIGTSTTKP
jgi:hypothetical protein